jgi:hypothetical protein
VHPVDERPYVAPLTRSIAGAIGAMIPSRSSGRDAPAAHLATEDNATHWTPWGILSALVGPLMSSGPLAGLPTRPAIGDAYDTPSAGWNLAGVSPGWSLPMRTNLPGSAPTPKMAVGRWTPLGGVARPLPTLPSPARMVRPWP